METIITYLLFVAGIYLLTGVLFVIIFLAKGIHQVDTGTADTSRFFKVLLFPGMTIFWPYFLKQWINSHK